MQRIQTVYLLAAAALLGIFMINPLATFSSNMGVYTMSVFNIATADGTSVSSLPHLLVITLLAALLPSINIFFYKKRMLQIRLCVVQMVLSLGALAIAGVYYHLSNRTFGAGVGGDASIRIVCALPIISIVFDYLALKAIFKDEVLIKSIDRIR